MRSPIFLLSPLLLLLLATLVAGTPTPDGGNSGKGNNNNNNDNDNDHDHGKGCLSKSEADALMHTWISFFTVLDPNLAKKTLTPDFHLFSESTNSISHAFPVSNPQYSSRDAFIAGQTAAPGSPVPSFDVVASDHGCNSFTFRWLGHFDVFPPDAAATAAGIAGIDFVFLKPGTRMLEKAYSEWDSLHLARDFGCTC